MKILMKLLLYCVLFLISNLAFSQNLNKELLIDDLIGHWDFSDSNDLTNAKIGLPLELTGTAKSVIGPFGAIEIGIGSYLTATHGITPNFGDTKINKYTVVMDIKLPIIEHYYALYQTNILNNDDGDWFVNPSGNIGIGQLGYTSDQLTKDEWYRLSIVVSIGEQYDYYIDGVKIHSGQPNNIDGRFALDDKILFFADDNNEDNTLSVADIKIYSRALSDEEIKTLGGYPHNSIVNEVKTYPYLQSPTPTSIYVCWTYKGENPSVEFGLTANLGNQQIPEIITFTSDPELKWFSAKLENLEPSTVYYYKVKTDSLESLTYKFKTQPLDSDSTQHVRFAIYGDNRTVPSKFKEVNDSLLSMANSLYGNNIEENLNLVFDVGDIVTNGNSLSQYLPEYFIPTNPLSTSVPFMVSIGNHEKESPNYYKFMKYEDFGGSEGEKYYHFRIGRVLFISLNSNSALRNQTQLNWLNQVLTEAEADKTIEWIFAFLHHPGHSELWPDGNTSYVQDEVIPILAKFSKVDLLAYGHSHNYERGTALNGDFRLMLNGGAGSVLDRWEMYNNQQNYPEIQKSFDHYCYSIVDIDIANKICNVITYSLGNPDNKLDNVVIDKFFRNKFNETPPTKPSLILPEHNAEKNIDTPFELVASEYIGPYDIMSSQFQISSKEDNFEFPNLNVSRDLENVYGTPLAPEYALIDLNLKIDLTKLTLSQTNLSGKYWWRVRYRDKNLQWSDWSDVKSFSVLKTTGIQLDENIVVSEYKLYNNFPNPFNPTTTIQFDLPEKSFVNISILNSLGELVEELENVILNRGHYSRSFDASSLSSGIYFYRIVANNYIKVKKMTLLK